MRSVPLNILAATLLTAGAVRAGETTTVMASLNGRHAECRYLKLLCRDERRANQARIPAYKASPQASKRYSAALGAGRISLDPREPLNVAAKAADVSVDRAEYRLLSAQQDCRGARRVFEVRHPAGWLWCTGSEEMNVDPPGAAVMRRSRTEIR